MKERMNKLNTQLKTLWNRVCVKSKAFLSEAQKCLSYCAKELSANTQDLFLKTVTWFFHYGKVWVTLVLRLLRFIWLAIAGLAIMITTKVKALRSPKAETLPSAEPEPAAEVEPVAEVPAVETTEVIPAITEEPEVPVAVKAKPSGKEILHRIWSVLCTIGRVIKSTVKWIWKLRGLLMSLPVAVVAIKLAVFNMERLPEVVGLDIQASGEFAHSVSRQMAVFGPLAITAFCILLTVGSKKPLFPWVISIFTLVLPPLLWFLNYYA